ncbi:MAG: phosphoglucosamine mutase [bacterium]
MSDSHLIIGVSGMRGIVFDPLSPEVCTRAAAAFAGVVGRGTVVVGRDTRPSGEILKMAVISGLAAAGADVVDLGIVPTPTVQLAVEHHKASGGIAVTASHNPAQWNALKFVSRAGTFLEKPDVDKVAAALKSGPVAYAAAAGAGRVRADLEACARHIALVLALPYVQPSAIARRGFKVAIDCVNGAAAAAIPDLLSRLGCKVLKLDCELSGAFTRNPEPLAENLGLLGALVRREGADLGFGFDPDGDRLAVVDERGEPLGEDYTLAICADLVLKRKKGPLVTNLSTSLAVEDVAGRHGVSFARTPIGEINVVAGMKRAGAVIGGEGNGGVILPEAHYGRDALVGVALVLQALLESGGTLSAMMSAHTKYVIVKQKIAFDQAPDFDRLAGAIRAAFAGASFNLEDGIRADLGGSWVHVRRSGTEPVVRVIAEASDRDAATALAQRARSAVE